MLSEKLLEFSLLGAEWVLVLLIGLSLLSIAVMFERLLLYRRTRERFGALEPRFISALQSGDAEAVRAAVAGDSLVRNVLRAGIDRLLGPEGSAAGAEQAMLGALARERARYGARLPILGTLGNNAPFVGLLGTVLGIIQAFEHLGHGAGIGDRGTELMAAIGAALVATGVGLIVAIPAVAAYNAARAHVGARVQQAEALMRAMLAGSSGPRGEG